MLLPGDFVPDDLPIPGVPGRVVFLSRSGVPKLIARFAVGRVGVWVRRGEFGPDRIVGGGGSTWCLKDDQDACGVAYVCNVPVEIAQMFCFK